MKTKDLNIFEELKNINFINLEKLSNNNSSELFNQFCDDYSEKIKVKEIVKKKQIIIFNELIILLNKKFNVSYNETYWRILIGPWFFVCFEVLYNRVNSLNLFLKKNPSKNYIFQNLKKNVFENKSNSEFHKKTCSIHWNQMIIYEIINDQNINKKVIELKYYNNKIKNKNFSNIKKKLKYILSKFLFHLNSFNKKIVFNSSLNFFDELLIQMKIMKIPLFFLPDLFENLKLKNNYDLSLREIVIKDFIKNEDNHKDQILKKMLIKNMPTIYLENYIDLTKQIDKSKLFDVILTSQHFNDNEYFKFLAAKNYLNKCKIIYLQHGNIDGTDKFDIYNNHMISPTKYLTWGWDHSFHEETNIKKKSKIERFYNLNGSVQKRFNKDSKFENQLIFFTCNVHKGIYFWDVQKLNQRLFNNQFKFLKNLDHKIINKTTIKFHHYEKYHQILNLKIDNLNKNFKKQFNFKKISKYKNLISVYSYDSSGFFEHITMNKPTIVYLENFKTNIVEEAIPYYSLLKNANIIHDSPESAANFLNSKWDNIKDWWYSVEIQEKINIFSEKFSRYSSNPKREILDIINMKNF